MNRDDEHIKRSVKEMIKSGKLWLALAGVAVGVLLLLFGGNIGDLLSGDMSQDVSQDQEKGGERLSMEDYRQA